jgi:hypothetical protein
MRNTFLLLLRCAAAAAWASDTHAPATDASQAPKAAASEDGNKMVCERVKTLGSQQVKRVCTTVAARAAARERAKTDLDRLGRCSGNDSSCSGSL